MNWALSTSLLDTYRLPAPNSVAACTVVGVNITCVYGPRTPFGKETTVVVALAAKVQVPVLLVFPFNMPETTKLSPRTNSSKSSLSYFGRLLKKELVIVYLLAWPVQFQSPGYY